MNGPTLRLPLYKAGAHPFKVSGAGVLELHSIELPECEVLGVQALGVDLAEPAEIYTAGASDPCELDAGGCCCAAPIAVSAGDGARVVLDVAKGAKPTAFAPVLIVRLP